jgi:hypothetical protein
MPGGDSVEGRVKTGVLCGGKEPDLHTERHVMLSGSIDLRTTNMKIETGEQIQT